MDGIVPFITRAHCSAHSVSHGTKHGRVVGTMVLNKFTKEIYMDSINKQQPEDNFENLSGGW